MAYIFEALPDNDGEADSAVPIQHSVSLNQILRNAIRYSVSPGPPLRENAFSVFCNRSLSIVLWRCYSGRHRLSVCRPLLSVAIPNARYAIHLTGPVPHENRVALWAVGGKHHMPKQERAANVAGHGR